MGRLIMVTMGIGFITATLALTVPSVQRGYFTGKHEKIFRRGTPMYNFHCVLMLLALGAGAGFIGAGLFLPPDKLMRGQQ